MCMGSQCAAAVADLVGRCRTPAASMALYSVLLVSTLLP